MSIGPGIGSIEAGRATIKIVLNDDVFIKQWKQFESTIKKTTDTLTRVAAGATAAGGAILLALGQTTRSAIESETALRRFNLVFGETQELMRSTLRDIAAATGMSMTTLQRQASGFGLIFSELREQASPEDFTRVVGAAQKAVVDLVGVAGIDMVEAQARIMSGLTSTGESLDQFGFKLRQAELNAVLLSMGIDKDVRQLAEMEKMLIKVAIMQEAIARGQLDFANMAATVRGRLAQLQSQLEELYKHLNKYILPVLRSILWILTQTVKILNLPIFRQFISIWGAIGAGWGAALLIGGLFLGLIVAITIALASFITSIATLNAHLIAHTGLVSIAAVATDVWLVSQLALNKALAMGLPILAKWAAAIGPLVLAIGAIAVGISQTITMMQGLRELVASEEMHRVVDFERPDSPSMKQRLRAIGRLWWTAVNPFGRGMRREVTDPSSRLWQILSGEGEKEKRQVGPRAAGVQGILGSRQMTQQMAFLGGVATPEESTAQNTGRMAKMLERVTEGNTIRVTGDS